MSSKPCFSIILPTFNRADLILKAIRSVQNQSERSWELIIVNDGSTDHTRELIHQELGEDPRLRYIEQENKGASVARNHGIQVAKGRFLCFLDSDDTLEKEHLKLRFQMFLGNPELDFVYGAVNVSGDPYVVDKYNLGSLISLFDPSVLIGGSFAVRRSAALLLGGFPQVRFSEDGDFFLKAVRRKMKTARLPVATYNYNRQSPDSISDLIRKETFSNLIRTA